VDALKKDSAVSNEANAHAHANSQAHEDIVKRLIHQDAAIAKVQREIEKVAETVATIPPLLDQIKQKFDQLQRNDLPNLRDQLISRLERLQQEAIKGHEDSEKQLRELLKILEALSQEQSILNSIFNGPFVERLNAYYQHAQTSGREYLVKGATQGKESIFSGLDALKQQLRKHLPEKYLDGTMLAIVSVLLALTAMVVGLLGRWIISVIHSVLCFICCCRRKKKVNSFKSPSPTNVSSPTKIGELKLSTQPSPKGKKPGNRS